jgi:hypothetical protein
MQGRIKQKLAEASASYQAKSSEPVRCPLCDRCIPPSQRDAHHLVPKSRGGVETVWLHRICHRQIHALLSEAELERDYRFVDALRSHPEMARFLQWVKTKPDDFFERTRKSLRIRRR